MKIDQQTGFYKLRKLESAVLWLGNGMGSSPASWEVLYGDDVIGQLIGIYQHGDRSYDWRWVMTGCPIDEPAGEKWQTGYRSRQLAFEAIKSAYYKRRQSEKAKIGSAFSWDTGLKINLTNGEGQVFAIHEIGPDEATHLLATIVGKEGIEAYSLDLDRIGAEGASGYQDDLFTALQRVIDTARLNRVY